MKLQYFNKKCLFIFFTISLYLFVKCGRALLQSTVVVVLLVVQALKGEPVTEGQLQHLKFVDEVTCQCKMYKSVLFKVIEIDAQLDRI